MQPNAGVPPDALPPLVEIIRRHGLAPQKSLGQHFLHDPSLLARIVALAGPLAGRHVVEIGPGPGGLTRALLATGAERVHAVELDRRAIAALDELAHSYPGRLAIHAGNALATDLAGLAPAPRQVVANLPYNVGTPILVGLLRGAAAWERLTLMFQLEVAERIVAAPGSDAYGRLAVLAGWTTRAHLAATIPPGAFFPPPKVTSAVVCLVPRPDQPSPALFRRMERVTAAAFGQRRKMLRGALRPLGGEALLERAGIAGTRRAETLDIQEFVRLAQALEAPNQTEP